MDVQPLRGSLGEAAFERLREGISGGKWAPGQRLPSERALAEHLAISRPALREAVKRLEGEGLIDVRPRRGLYVRAASADRLSNSFERLIGTDFDRVNELLDLRRVLEHRSAYLAAEYAGPEDIAELAAIFADIESDVSAGGTGDDGDVRFHCAIAKAAGNTVLTHLMATLHGALSTTVTACSNCTPASSKPSAATIPKPRPKPWTPISISSCVSFRNIARERASRDKPFRPNGEEGLGRRGEQRARRALRGRAASSNGTTNRNALPAIRQARTRARVNTR